MFGFNPAWLCSVQRCGCIAQYSLSLCAGERKLSIPRIIAWTYFQDQFNTQWGAAAKDQGLDSTAQSAQEVCSKLSADQSGANSQQQVIGAAKRWKANATLVSSPADKCSRISRLRDKMSPTRTGTLQAGSFTSVASHLMHHPPSEDAESDKKQLLHTACPVEKVHQGIQCIYSLSKSTFLSLEPDAITFDMAAQGSPFSMALSSMGLSHLCCAMASVAENHPDMNQATFVSVFLTWAGADLSSSTGFPQDKTTSRAQGSKSMDHSRDWTRESGSSEDGSLDDAEAMKEAAAIDDLEEQRVLQEMQTKHGHALLPVLFLPAHYSHQHEPHHVAPCRSMLPDAS